MLKIRQEQLDALDRARERDFVRQAAAHVRQVFPERTFDEAELKALIGEGIRKAERYGLPSERDTALLIDLMAALGRDFDEQPANAGLASVLRDTTVDGESRMDLVYELVQLRSEPGEPLEEEEA